MYIYHVYIYIHIYIYIFIVPLLLHATWFTGIITPQSTP